MQPRLAACLPAALSRCGWIANSLLWVAQAAAMAPVWATVVWCQHQLAACVDRHGGVTQHRLALLCHQYSCTVDRNECPMNAVCETTVALVVRQGNPRRISGWEDLLQPGLQARAILLPASCVIVTQCHDVLFFFCLAVCCMLSSQWHADPCPAAWHGLCGRGATRTASTPHTLKLLLACSPRWPHLHLYTV